MEDDGPSMPLSSPPHQYSAPHSSPRAGPSREAPPSPVQLPTDPPPPTSPQPGPSTAPDPVLGETDETTSSLEDIELDEEILKLLGDAPKPDSALGKSIHKDIASRWKEILTKGLQKEVKDKILQDYLVPSNCELLIAPILNPEAKAALPNYLITRDASLMQRQKQIGSALAALAQATELIIKKNSSPQDILKPLSDACRILCDSHFSETKTRRNFVISALNTKLKEALINTERDKFLFGDNVSDKVKAAQTIQKSGDTLKSTPKPSYGNHFNKNNFAVRNKTQKGNLNFKPLHQKPSNQSKPDAGRPRPAQAASRPNAQQRASKPRSPPRRPYRR